MTRTDDGSQHITESVGAPALGIAWARAQEASSSCPLFTDSYAQRFVDVALARGWQLPPSHMSECFANYAAARTKWFDDFFTTAGANGIVQAVILKPGLDARAWRLPWTNDSVVYEVDQPEVLALKAEILANARPATRYVPVPIDLRNDWPKALQEAGFDPYEPTAWAAEGLLPPVASQGHDLLFERIDELSARGSRVGIESSGTDIAERLMDRGWRVSSEEAGALMRRYGRPPTAAGGDTATTFVEGVRC